MVSGKCSKCGSRITESGSKGLTRKALGLLKKGKYVCSDCRHQN